MKSKYYFCSLIFFLFFSVFEKANAQAPSWQWAKSAGGLSFDYNTKTAKDGLGNLYVTGFFSSPYIVFGPDTLYNSGADDMFLVKYDAGGNVLWARKKGKTGDELAYSVIADSIGNVYIAGNFTSNSLAFGSYILHNKGGSDVFLLKYGPNGNPLWATSAGWHNQDGAQTIALDDNGNVFLAGYFESSEITFGTTTLLNYHPYRYDIFIVKYDSSGNVLWAKSAGGSHADFAYILLTDHYGNVYVSGQFQSYSILFGTTMFYNHSLGSSDLFTLKYDNAGNFIWAKTWGGNYTDEFCSLLLADSGNIYQTGYFKSDSITFGSTTFYDSQHGNLFIIKYDTSGNVLAAKVQDSLWWHTANADNNGNIYVGGGFIYPTLTLGTTTLYNQGGTDIFLEKLNPTGNVLWALSEGGNNSDVISGITIDSNKVFVSGIFDSPSITFGSSTVINYDTSNSNEDIFLAKLSFCSTMATINKATCNSYTSPSGNYVWTSSGTYNDTVPNAGGCDSVITIYLVINNTYSSQTITTCNNYTAPSGNYVWTASGVYLDTVPNSVGCDSVISINLTINTIDTTVTQTGNVLTAIMAGAAYQWLDCDNGLSVINGATNQIFAPSTIGNYAVAITQNGCIDTSNCSAVIGVGINEASSIQNFIISPNPVKDLLVISYSTYVNKKATITITDARGKLVYKNDSPAKDIYSVTKTEINTKDFSEGVYLVQIQTEDFIETRKVLVLR